MRITFWGVRGSIPAPGPETNRYGGNTACVAIHTASGALIIIDMGTGLAQLGNALMATEFGKGQGQATILLSHSHWDHIQGFPFFPPVFVPGNRFVVYGNAKSPSMLEGILEGQMNPHFSPLYTLKNLGAAIDFRTVAHGNYFELDGGVRVRARPNPHGGITALAFRLEEDGKSFVYASDAGYPEGVPSAEMLDLYRGADLLLHDATYTIEDQATRRNRGFSSYAEAALAAVSAEVKHLIMFHYDQDYSDDDVDRLAASCRQELDRLGGGSIALTAAAEGESLEL
ncbi:MBL fold metallo-hydrolase [Haliangium sp.]|uniref:MBL fold metallo-hydrolase n=1 Tax=Haliangium sp. TaxID=2663208 RepID=UPI003D0F426B